MRCFYHHDLEAVGMCTVCNKGLCERDAVEVSGFVYCRTHAREALAEEERPRPAVRGRVEEEAISEAEGLPEAPSTPKARHAQPPKARPARLQPKVLLKIRPKNTVTAAVVGGIVSGMLTGIPFLNLVCFVWMLLGGAAAAYLLMLKESAAERVRGYISETDGAIVGGISGFFGANIAIIMNLFAAVNFGDLIHSALVSLGRDPQTASTILQIIAIGPNLDIVNLLLRYILMLIVFPVFGAAGGWAAAKLAK